MTAPARRTDDSEARLVGGSPLLRIAHYALLLLFTLFFIIPLVWMTITAFKPDNEWLRPNWIPLLPTLDNFTELFADPTLPIARWFFNSFFIATAFTLLILVIDSLAAYAYARMQFRGRGLLFGLMLTTLVMPGIMFLVPNYITISTLDWIGTYQGVIAPGLAGVFGVFFLRQFF